MRKAETIEKELLRLQSNQYARFNSDKIGALLWVLGKSSTIMAGVKHAYETNSKQPTRSE